MVRSSRSRTAAAAAPAAITTAAPATRRRGRALPTPPVLESDAEENDEERDEDDENGVADDVGQEDAGEGDEEDDAAKSAHGTGDKMDSADDQQALEDEEDNGTPAADSEQGSPVPPYTRGRGRPGRRRGRRPGGGRGGVRRQDSNADREPDATPRRRGWRGRGFGAGRWAKARGSAPMAHIPVDKDGNMAKIVNDEVELPEDVEGEQKVAKTGALQGNREYRVRTFTVEGKGDRLYMLSTEPARCIGFRDSYLFFQKHKQLYKIIIDEEAKKDLIDRGIIPHSYKGRAIGIVTARSVFREFGSQIIVRGKKITDDYQVSEARARGDVEGELAVPEDELPETTQGYDRNRYVAWHGASSVYHSGGSGVPMINGKPIELKRRKIPITGANWMAEHAHAARHFNAALAAQRRQNLDGLYDVHTNSFHYPRIMQPTHARWERPSTSAKASQGADLDDAAADTIFPAVSDVHKRKFMVADTYYESPQTSTLGYPGPDEALMDVDPPGLLHVPDSLLSELPSECYDSFLQARDQERAWKTRWGFEETDHARARLNITYSS